MNWRCSQIHQTYAKRTLQRNSEFAPSHGARCHFLSQGALEQLLHSSDGLHKQYVDVYQVLLRKAELRLTEYQLNDFRHLESKITDHVSEWHEMVKMCNQHAITLRRDSNSVLSQMSALKQTIGERDLLIEAKNQEIQRLKHTIDAMTPKTSEHSPDHLVCPNTHLFQHISTKYRCLFV